MVVFNPINHTYTNSVTNEIYPSVTTILEKYHPVFDKQKHATRSAERYGVTVDFILNEWQEINKQSTDYGKEVHKVIETYIKTETLEDDKWNWLLQGLWDTGLFNVKSSKLLTENLLYSDTYKIAGTTDLIISNSKSFSIVDFKTNKKFNTLNKYGENLLDPVSHLNNSQYSTYSLQLSLYAFLYQLDTKKNVDELKAYYIDKEAKTIQVYNTPYLKTDVLNIINHYNANK